MVILIQANVGDDKRGKKYTWVYTKLHRSANSNFEERMSKKRESGGVMNEVIVFDPR